METRNLSQKIEDLAQFFQLLKSNSSNLVKMEEIFESEVKFFQSSLESGESESLPMGNLNYEDFISRIFFYGLSILKKLIYFTKEKNMMRAMVEKISVNIFIYLGDRNFYLLLKELEEKREENCFYDYNVTELLSIMNKTKKDKASLTMIHFSLENFGKMLDNYLKIGSPNGN